MNGEPRFEDYMRLVSQCAGKVFRRLKAAGTSVCFDDVYQDMCLSFVKAQRSFDPTFGVAFTTFLVRTCFNNANRMVDAECKEKHAALDARITEDSEAEVLDTIADDAPSPEDVLLQRRNTARLLRKLSADARKFTTLVNDPPAALAREYHALQARRDFGRSKGIENLTPVPRFETFVADVLGMTISRRRTVMREIGQLVSRERL